MPLQPDETLEQFEARLKAEHDALTLRAPAASPGIGMTDPAAERRAAAQELRQMTPQARAEVFRALTGRPLRWSSADTLGADLPPGARHVRDLRPAERDAEYRRLGVHLPRYF